MDLEAGMYVRLENDVEDIVIINRIANVFETTILTENDGSIYQGEYTKENVIKASYNIINILEEGDIISFYEDIDNYKKQYVIGIPDLITLDKIKDKITNDNIRLVSILTKEQMEQMAYKVGE